jgi:hypothetical protein
VEEERRRRLLAIADPIEAEEARSRWSRLAISPTVPTTHQFTELATQTVLRTLPAQAYRRIFEMAGLRAPPRESDTPAARATRAAILRSTDTARHLRERQRHLSNGAMLLAEIRAVDITDQCPKQETTTSSTDDDDVPELEGSTDDDDVVQVGATKEQNVQDAAARRDRARSIQLHMQLLVHASGCVNQACPSANCSKMKALLKHGATCTMRATGGCHICRRIWALLQIHARQCRQTTCPVPRCRDLKEHLRRLQRQQAE